MSSTLYVVGEWFVGGNYKIGRTDAARLDARLAELQTGNPNDLKYAVIAHGLGWMEKPLQRAFANEQLKGEWYRGDAVVHAFVEYLRTLPDGISNPTVADVFSAASYAMNKRAAPLRVNREKWDAARYEAKVKQLRETATHLSALADQLAEESTQRFNPDHGLPSFAEAIKRKQLAAG